MQIWDTLSTHQQTMINAKGNSMKINADHRFWEIIKKVSFLQKIFHWEITGIHDLVPVYERFGRSRKKNVPKIYISRQKSGMSPTLDKDISATIWS